jgi:hypothetical protein
MYKFILATMTVLFAGCTQVTYNAQMCNKIAKDPTETIPQECIPYIEEEAAKASVVKEKQITPKESIEFTK